MQQQAARPVPNLKPAAQQKVAQLMLERSAQPLLLKPPDLPAVGTRLLFALYDDSDDGGYATVTRHELSRRDKPGQWRVRFHWDHDDDGCEDGWAWCGPTLKTAVARAAKHYVLNSQLWDAQ